MPEALAQAQAFEELLERPDPKGPYIYHRIFSSDGRRARRLSSRKFRLLRRLDGRIRAMLHPGEQVYFLCAGIGSSFWEWYFVGALVALMNRRAFVFTNERILLIQTDWRGRPKELHTQIRYPAIERVDRTMVGHTRIRFRGGRRVVFIGMPKSDRTFMRSTIELLRDRLAGAAAVHVTDWEDLCPHCYEPVPGRPTACPACRRPFKSWRRAGLLSLLLPGLGDVYLGHIHFALFEILVAALLWINILVTARAAGEAGGAILVIMAVMVFLFFHVPDAIATLWIARKGHYPAGPHGRTRAVPGSGR